MTGYIIQNPSTFPSHLQNGLAGGSFKPAINNDITTRRGFDFSVKAQKQFGDVYASLGVVGTYLYNVRSKFDEIKDEEYLKEEGRPIDAIWGFQNLGFYQESDFTINDKGKLVLKEGLPTPSLGGSVQPGDLKYVDQNNDGKIDTKDKVYLGQRGTFGAPVTLGFNITVKWKNFTLFILGNGDFGAYGLKNNSYYNFNGENKYSVEARNRWTKETAATATLPRLTAGSGVHNGQDSDFWMYSTDRFNIRKVQLTYDFPKELWKNKWVKYLTIYISGNDLLTIAKERKILETSIGYAPQTRFYNLGVKVTL